MPPLQPGEIRITLLIIQGESKVATESAVQQIKAFFVSSNGVVCTKAADAATASGD